MQRVSIYRLISMYNGSDSNTSAHTRFAKPLETLRISHYPETYSIIHYLSPTEQSAAHAPGEAQRELLPGNTNVR